jgi:hypothetical protein
MKEIIELMNGIRSLMSLMTYPEMVFVMLSLNEKCRAYAKKLTKDKFFAFDNKDALGDKSLSTVRNFQIWRIFILNTLMK